LRRMRHVLRKHSIARQPSQGALRCARRAYQHPPVLVDAVRGRLTAWRAGVPRELRLASDRKPSSERAMARECADGDESEDESAGDEGSTIEKRSSARPARVPPRTLILCARRDGPAAPRRAAVISQDGRGSRHAEQRASCPIGRPVPPRAGSATIAECCPSRTKTCPSWFNESHLTRGASCTYTHC
jgi:hypothetical protein